MLKALPVLCSLLLFVIFNLPRILYIGAISTAPSMLSVSRFLVFMVMLFSVVAAIAALEKRLEACNNTMMERYSSK